MEFWGSNQGAKDKMKWATEMLSWLIGTHYLTLSGTQETSEKCGIRSYLWPLILAPSLSLLSCITTCNSKQVGVSDRILDVVINLSKPQMSFGKVDMILVSALQALLEVWKGFISTKCSAEFLEYFKCPTHTTTFRPQVSVLFDASSRIPVS